MFEDMAFSGFFHTTAAQRPDQRRRPSTAKCSASLDSEDEVFYDALQGETTPPRTKRVSLTHPSPPIEPSPLSDRIYGMSSVSSTAFAIRRGKQQQQQKASSSDGSLSKTSTHSSTHSPSPGPGTGSIRDHAIGVPEQRGGVQIVEYDTRSGSISSASIPESSGSIQIKSVNSATTSVYLKHPFGMKNGRRYLRDPSLPYPLPCDIQELHRQTLQTMLMVNVFGGPICCSKFRNTPPKRILDLACGTGYWSSLCHQHYAKKGHSIEFVGLDVVEVAPNWNGVDGMKWKYVHHNMQTVPLPFEDEQFDMIMVQGGSLVTTYDIGLQLLEEYLRILRPGGVLEIWETDSTIRMLLPHQKFNAGLEDSESDHDEQRAKITGTYPIVAAQSLAQPQNQYLLDYNEWVSKALMKRMLTITPCTDVRPFFISQDETLKDVDSRRIAIPFGEIRWEREGIGGTITNERISISSRGSSLKSKAPDTERKVLSATQAAIRRTALLTFVQKIEALEPCLMEVSGKGQDEWDRWLGNMMNDLLNLDGTSWGECLEAGAFWASKSAESSIRTGSRSTEASRTVPVYGPNPSPSPKINSPEKTNTGMHNTPQPPPARHGLGGSM